ncbi:MAG: DUF3857 domain-containing protein, partial [Caulobacteraceae bacterium]
QGLSYVNAIAPWWNPATAGVTFHKFEVLRGGKVIDLLGGGKKVTVLRRETDLERQMLDGTLTATVQPEGLEVGDVVDVAFTLADRDPVLHGYANTVLAAPRPSVVRYMRIRALWPTALPVAWRATDGMPRPKLVHEGDTTELLLGANDFEAPKPPAGAPSRYNDVAQLELSRFQSWAAVSALMAPLYEKAEVPAPNSSLKDEARKIAALSPDPKVRAEAALRLVQDKVRYFALAMNEGGFVPADADLTWSRKFGDCKGKTVLLLALLHALGIQAEPALVSTVIGDGLDKRLPGLLFDHVIVKAEIGGKTYWLDGTRIGDRALDNIATPDFHWALPVQASGARLEQLVAPPLQEPQDENLIKLDATAGIDKPARAHAGRLFRGDLAVGWNVVLTAAGARPPTGRSGPIGAKNCPGSTSSVSGSPSTTESARCA